MSKELIEKLRNVGGAFGELMHEAADALEAKAAPVGEREAFEAKYPAAKKLEFRGGVYLNRLGSELPRSVRDGINDAWVDFQAGAAYQRQQAREVVMPERDDRAIGNKFDLFFKDGWNACLDEFALLNKGAGSYE